MRKVTHPCPFLPLTRCPRSHPPCASRSAQGRTAESFQRWRLLNGVLAESGRAVPEECPICAEPFSPERACVALSCGHSFHR